MARKIHLAGLLKQLKDGLVGTRHRALTVALPIDEWCEVPGAFRFGLPWPWTVAESGDDLVDARGLPAAIAPLALVRAPRTDGEVDFLIWADQGSVPASGSGLGGSLARLYQGRLVEQNQLMLGGIASFAALIEDGHDLIWRVIVPYQGQLLHGEARLPRGAAAGYRPQLETMLASWTWLG